MGVVPDIFVMEARGEVGRKWLADSPLTELQTLPPVNSTVRFFPIANALPLGLIERRSLSPVKYDEFNIMKMLKTLIATVSAIAVLGMVTTSFAAEKAAKEKTISGTAKCAKCSLKEADKCQTVIEKAGKNGKTTKIYLEDNDVAKNFHEQICKEADGKKVKATGTTAKVDGKMVMTASKIETE